MTGPFVPVPSKSRAAVKLKQREGCGRVAPPYPEPKGRQSRLGGSDGQAPDRRISSGPDIERCADVFPGKSDGKQKVAATEARRRRRPIVFELQPQRENTEFPVMEVKMSECERQAFESFARAAGSYFEYGMGGSTVLASNLVKGPIAAVDSSKQWLDKVQGAIDKSTYGRNLMYVDIGPTRDWGFPLEEGPADKFRPYFNAIAEHDPLNVDLCLVDGRFRIACFLSALKYTRADTVIGIHDYRNRKHYHVAEEYGRIISEVESISFFIRRRDVSLVRVEKAIEHYGSISL